MTLTTQKAEAQVCGNALAASPTISPISGSKVVVGQTVTITKVFFGSSDPANCLFRNGEGFLLYPNGTVVRVVTNLDLNPPGTPPFNSFLNCFGTNSTQPEGTAFAFATNYVVSAADVGKSNGIVLPVRGQLTAPQSIPFAGAPNTITFGAAGDTDGFNPGSPTSPTGVATGSGSQFLTVVSPGLTVTKVCDSNCFEYGALITFHGTVCNTGNVDLVNVVVSNTLAGGVPALVASFPVIPAGACSNYVGSEMPFGDLCGPFTNTVVASGVAASVFQTPTFSATNKAVCDVCSTPCIAVTKNCSPQIITNNPGISQFGLVTFTGYVTNCGDVPLTNVTVFDTFLGKTILTVPFLTNGAFVAYTTNYQTVSNDCGRTITNTVIATGTDVCGSPSVTNMSSCEFTVVCKTPPPQICITKEVACYRGTNLIAAVIPSSPTSDEFCGSFSNSATGVSGNQNPAFCYSITISNCGPVPLTNVTVVDNQFGNFTTNFFPGGPSTVFEPGSPAITYLFKAEVGQDLTNVATTVGQSAVDGTFVTNSSQAVVTVIPASVECSKQYTIDGGSPTNDATLPDSNPHTIVWYVTVSNPSSQVNLGSVVVTDVTTSLPCGPFGPITVSLPAGASTNILVCSNIVSCTNGFDGVTNSVSVVASDFTLTNGTPVCGIDINSSNVVVTSECGASLFCSHPAACRVTGGGRQDAPNVFPADVRYVTHGGQVGAPVGDAICAVTVDFPIGNPCIHGRWTHVRHMQGGNEGNFHARFYDTLQCACLDTTLTPAVTNFAGVDGASGQTYTNLYYGPGTILDTVCNPGNRLAGPEPSPAPANKIVFTGVGDYALTVGQRVPVSVLFRVDVEDRGEPGGSHPIGSGSGGSKDGRIPDRNRTRIWILTDQELAELRGAGPDKLLLNFRNAISACNGINVQDGATVTNGAPAFGVRQPDIDDGGELDRGNYQIHPSILSCDPANPVGPGLAKP